MEYAVFRLKEWEPPHRTTLTYGRDDTDAAVGFISMQCNSTIVERCATIKVASASMALRNAVNREISTMIAVAVRRQAPHELVALLNDLRDADPPSASDLVEVHRSALGFLKTYGIDLGRSWSDDARINTRLGRRLQKYLVELKK